jgi:hypothetical protein
MTASLFSRFSFLVSSSRAMQAPLLALTLAVGSGASLTAQAAEPKPSNKAGKTSLVTQAENGALLYQPYSKEGDILPDFSNCGYAGGEMPLPDAPVRETLKPEPGDGDDHARIQAALDRVAKLEPDASGIRGAVLLTRGVYRCSDSLRMNASGVVLRGEGDGENDTVIRATARKQQPLVVIGDNGRPDEMSEKSVDIVDDYAPVGARSFNVANASGFKVGQTVFVVRRGNSAWITEIGMDKIVPRAANPGSTKQWESFDMKFDRVITAIEGARITVDAPIVCALDKRWGGGAIVPYDDKERISRCGVEFLRSVSDFDKNKTADYKGESVFVDEDHTSYIVAFRSVKNAWARKLTSVSLTHGPAQIGGQAKWITVEDCQALSPVSQITGGRRYPYAVDGQLNLIQRCFAEKARHAFVFGARVPGPNVFLECRSVIDYATSEPHHRWSVGGLYDNVDANMAIQDRQWMGSGHGWSGANYVVWNSRGQLICQKPPTAQNFAIGFVGKKNPGAFPRPDGWWESEGKPVQPQSLYKAQLAARLKR